MNQTFDAQNGNGGQDAGAISTFVQEPEEQQASPFRKIHAKLRGRYLWAIALGLIGAVAAGGGAYFKFKPKFMSRGLISIAPVLPRMIYNSENSNVMPMFDAFIGTQVELMSSQRVLQKAMESDEWKAEGRGFTPEAQTDFSDALDVLRPARTNMVLVTFTDGSPDAAVVAVRAVIDAYEEIYVERDIQSDNDRKQMLETRRGVLNNKLKALKERIHAKSKGYGPLAYRRMYEWKIAELSDLKDRYNQTTLALSHATHAEAANAAGGGEALTNIPLEQLARTDPGLGNLLGRKEALLELLDMAVVQGRLENHKSVRLHNAMLKRVNEKIARYVEARASGEVTAPTVVGANDGDNMTGMTAQEIQAHLDMLTEEIDKADISTKALSRTIFEIDALEVDANNIRQLLADTATRIDQLNVEAQGRVSGRIQVISQGEYPLVPVNRAKRKQLTAFAVLGGGVLGSSLVLLIGALDKRLRSSEDARDSIGRVRVLGVLPGLPDDLSDPEHARIAGYCVHHIRTMLQLESGRPDRQVIAITSPAGGTGKTSLTLALGLSFAASGSRTLLVDSDLNGGGLTSRLRAIIRRRVGQILQRQGLLTSQQLEEALQHAEASSSRLGESLIDLGVLAQEDLDRALNIQEDARIGLLDALDGEDFDHCVAQTSTNGLSILPIGGAKAYDMSRLSPAAVRRVVNEARQRFDVILLDAGPIPSTVETSMVAAEADDVVLVVSRGDQRTHAENAIAFLESIGAHIAGLVFNRAAAGDVARSVHALSVNPSTPPVDDVAEEAAPPQKTESEHLGPVARAVVNTSHAPNDRS